MDDLKKLSDEAEPGPWLYRPFEFDDWGVIRGTLGSPEEDGFNNPPVAKASARWDDRDYSDHRAKGTDPMEANGRFIVELVNAYRAGRLVEAPPHADT